MTALMGEQHKTYGISQIT